MSIRELFELQQFDLQIDKANTEIKQIEHKLGNNAIIAGAKSLLAKEQKALDSLNGQRKDLDLQLENLNTKIDETKKQMYGGKVTSSKELASLEKNAGLLEEQKKQLEAQVLVLMEQIEKQQKLASDASKSLQGKESVRGSDAVGFNERVQQLKTELKILTKDRQAEAVEIDTEELANYGKLRQRRPGVVVSKVERGMCTGCRLNVPARDISRARGNVEIVYCSSCGRILYVI
ncbi:MAG: hypothetical protein EXR59_03875 [Dehalococcoidia bacterium]|nr:hypothetical protein [Dehalococcoidia bacterium]